MASKWYRISPIHGRNGACCGVSVDQKLAIERNKTRQPCSFISSSSSVATRQAACRKLGTRLLAHDTQSPAASPMRRTAKRERAPCMPEMKASWLPPPPGGFASPGRSARCSAPGPSSSGREKPNRTAAGLRRRLPSERQADRRPPASTEPGQSPERACLFLFSARGAGLVLKPKKLDGPFVTLKPGIGQKRTPILSIYESIYGRGSKMRTQNGLP